MKRIAFTLIALLQLLPLAQGAAEDVIVRRDDGLSVGAADLEADATERIPPEIKRDLYRKPDNIRRTALNLLLRRHFAREAEAAGIDKDPQIAARLALARERILSEVRVQQLDGVPPEDAALEKAALAEYKANPDKFKVVDEVRVSHILIGNYRSDGGKLAAELLEKLKAGKADFVQLVLMYSDDNATRGKEGDLGFFERGRMLKEVEDASFALKKPGDLSGVVETKVGWHIIRLTERHTPGIKPFAEVRDELRRTIARRIADGRRNLVIEPLEQSVKFDGDAVEAYRARFK